MEITDRLFKEDPIFQGINEEQTYSFNTAPWGITAPTSGTVTIYNESYVDVTSTVTSGAVVVDGSTIYTPTILDLSSGVKYTMMVQFTDGTAIKEPNVHLYGQDLASGAIRTGMSDIVKRVRQLTNADVHEMAIGGDVYWSDADIQTVCDRHKQFIIEKDLEFEPQYIDGTVSYTFLPVGIDYIEKPASGATRWALRNSLGAEESTANYTFDYNSSVIEFDSTTGGTVSYNITCYTYDVHAAAADIWEWRLSNFALWYDFRSENKTTSRSQAFKQAKIMLDTMNAKKGSNILGEGDIRSSQITRADVKETL